MKNRLIIFLTGVMMLSACSEVLDVTPVDRITDNDVWNDENLVRLYMNGAYAAAFQQGLYRTTQIGHGTDELQSSKGNVTYYLIARGELTPDNVSDLPAYMNNWKNAYGTIRDVNIFLEKIEQSPIDNATKEQMIAEMRFIRAFLHAQLIWRYGGVPIIDYVFDLEDDSQVGRDSYDACVTFIVDELDEVMGVLPAQQPEGNLGLVSGDAARALKARVLLYAASPLHNPTNDPAKWQAASDAAEALLDAGYSLNGDYRGTFLAHNSEIIFARYFTQANSYELHFQVGRNGDNGWGSDAPTQNLVDAFEMNNGEAPFNDDGTVNVASGYDPENPYADRDPRLYATILHDGAVWMGRETETFTGGLDSREGPIAAWNGSMTGYYLKKFVPENIPPSGSTLLPTSPWIMFRYAEVLLNYAEAQYMLNNEEVAREYLNMVRSRPGVNMPDVTESGDELLKRIQRERQIELVFEGHRYFDVRRWMIAPQTETKDIMGITIEKQEDDSKTYTYKELIPRTWDDRLYFLPIPRGEIDRSRNSLDQNEGYN